MKDAFQHLGPTPNEGVNVMPENSFLPVHRPSHRALSVSMYYSRAYPTRESLLEYLSGLKEGSISSLAGEMGLKKSKSKNVLIDTILRLVSAHEENPN